jgi:hypothetical protein
MNCSEETEGGLLSYSIYLLFMLIVYGMALELVKGILVILKYSLSMCWLPAESCRAILVWIWGVIGKWIII